MRICFDYQIFWLQSQGGISRYYCELATHLSHLSGCEPRIIAPFHMNDNLVVIESENFVKTLGQATRRLFHNRIWDQRLRLNEQLLRWNLKRGRSILHETYYTHRLKRTGPRVTTIHDMIYEKFHHGRPEEYAIIAAKKRAITEADAVIAVSHHTMRDIVELYPGVRSKVFVVHHGVRFPASTQKSVADKPFFLFVGNRGWYKNFSAFFNVYASDPVLKKDLDICCFGGELPDEKEIKMITDAGLKGNVKYIRGDDSVLTSLYRSASALVYNSGYEGFGMPVLEAMYCGCPVICANTSALPEVAGNAALMIDPNHPPELERSLHEILNNNVRERLIAAGKEQASKFSWDRCARETLQVYEKLG